MNKDKDKKKDDKEYFAEQRKYLEENGCKICCQRIVEIIGGSMFKQERVVAITDLALFVFTKTGKHPRASYLWQNIEGIDLQGDTVSMQFKNGFIGIKTLEFSIIFGAISDILMRVLTKEEREEIGLTRFQMSDVYPNAASVFARFQNQIKIMKISPSDKSFDIIKNYLVEMTPIFNLGDFDDLKKILPLIIDIFKLARFITTVIIPAMPRTDPYKIASEIVKEKTYVSNIVFKVAPTRGFNEFMEALRTGSSQLVGVYFTEGLFDEEKLQNITSAVEVKKMGALGFKSCIDTSAMNYFYTNFLRSNIADSLTVLNLDYTKNVNTSALLFSMPYLSVLSIAYCDLEISGVFKSIFEAPILKLHALNLNGNKSSFAVDEFRFLPSSLTSVSCNDVEWAEGTMIPLMRLCLKSFKTGVKLSLAYAKATTDEFVRVFNFLCQGQFTSLASFIWDGNPVAPKLLEFLRPNNGLEYLSFNGCFDKTYEEPIMALVSYLIKAPRLKCFLARGNDKANFGSYTPKVCAALKSCTTLTLIDLSETHSGDDGLAAMGQLMETTHRRVLITDGVYPENADQFYTFASLALSNPNILFSYPEHDIQWIIKNQMSNEEQIKYFLEQFLRQPRQVAHKKTPYTPPVNSVFDRKFVLYKYQETTEFPIYFTKQTIEELKTVNTTQVVSHPTTQEITPVSRKLNERMLQAQRMLYGDRAPSTYEERSGPSTYIPPTHTTTTDEVIEMEEIPTNQSQRQKSRRTKARGIGTETDDLPRQSDSRVSSISRKSTNDSGLRNSPRSQKSRKSTRKTKKSIVSDWTFPTITLAIDVDQFWAEFEEDFSLKNLYNDIKSFKKPQLMEYQ